MIPHKGPGTRSERDVEKMTSQPAPPVASATQAMTR